MVVEASGIERERNLLLNRVVSQVALDTVIENRMEIIADLLEDETSRNRQETRCDAIICSGDETRFQEARDAFDTTFVDNNYTEVAEINMGIRQGEISLEDTTNMQLISQLESIRLNEIDESAAFRSEVMLDVLFNERRLPIVEKLIFDANGKSMTFDTESASENKKLKLYPNPTNGQEITLELVDEVENPKVIIYNSMGQLMTTELFTNDTNKITMETNGFDSGVYFVEIQSNDQIIDRTKLVVQ